MPVITLNARNFFYRDEGSGPLVILAHCSNASNRQWQALVETLRPRYRVIAPDLSGYGRSDRWRAGEPFHAEIDVNLLLSLADLQGGPVHLAGHSYGAAMALEAARLLGPRAASLTLVEPPSFHLLRLAGREREWNAILNLTGRVFAAMRRGDKRKAAAAYMGFWIGRWRWLLAPAKVKSAVLETMDKTAVEFEMIRATDVSLEDYRTVRAPVQLVFGSRTTAEAKAVTRILNEILPGSTMHEVKGAGHMSPFTHAKIVNRLILEHIDRHGTQAGRAMQAEA
jgi:pimeloyl-ACP methyl ester carboxylesterase